MSYNPEKYIPVGHKQRLGSVQKQLLKAANHEGDRWYPVVRRTERRSVNYCSQRYVASKRLEERGLIERAQHRGYRVYRLTSVGRELAKRFDRRPSLCVWTGAAEFWATHAN